MQRSPASGIRMHSLRTSTNHDHRQGSEPADRGLTAVRRVPQVQRNARIARQAISLMLTSCRQLVDRLWCYRNQAHGYTGDQNRQRARRINLSIDDSQVRAAENMTFVIRSFRHRWTARFGAIVWVAVVFIRVVMNVPMIMLCRNVKMWSSCVIDQVSGRHPEMHMHTAQRLTGQHRRNQKNKENQSHCGFG